MTDNLDDLRRLDLPFDVDMVTPQCHQCVRDQLKKYEKFVGKDGVSAKGKFMVKCTGIPSQIIDPATRATLTDDQAEEIEANLNPVLFAKRYIQNNKKEPWVARNHQIDVLKCTSKRKCLRISRRSGKTDLVVIDVIYSAFTTDRLRILIIGPQKKHAQEIFNRVKEKIYANPYLAQAIVKDVSSPYSILTLKNGSEIRGFAGGTKGKGDGVAVRGEDADKIYLEEAAYIDENSIQGAIMPVLQTSDDVSLCAFSTPSPFKTTTYYKFCKESPHFKEFHYSYKVLPWWKNVEEERGSLTDEQWQCEYLAEFPDSGGGVYRPSYVERSLLDYRYEDMRRIGIWKYTMGVDWNEKHGAEIVVLGYDPITRRNQVVDAVNIEGAEFTQLASIQQVINMNKKWRPSFIYADRGNGCLDKESLVYTDCGVKQIQNIKIGDLVLTHEGRFKPITSVINTGVKESFFIKPSYCLPTKASNNHKHVIYRSVNRFNDFEKQDLDLKELSLTEVETRDINKKTDFMVIPRENISKAKKSCIVDLVEELSGFPNLEYDDNYVWTKHGYQTDRELTSKKIAKEFKTSIATIQRTRRKLKNKEEMTLTENKLCLQLNERYGDKWKSPELKKTNRFIDICDPDFLYIYGWYLSEGGSSKNNIEICQAPFHYKEEFGKLIRLCSERWDTNVLYRKKSGYIRLFIQNTLITALFKKIGGDYCYNKFIDPRIMASNPIPLIESLIYGDGCEHEHRIEMSLTSFELVSQTRQILINNGILPGLHYIKPRKKLGGWENYRSLPQLMLYFDTMDHNEELINGIFNSKTKSRNGIQRRKHFRTDKFFLVPIDKLESIGEVSDMYDISVEGDSTFCVNGFATHNSTNLELLYKKSQDAIGNAELIDLANIRNVLVGYDSGAAIMVQDVVTREKVKKPAKSFMVNCSVRLFEQNKIRLSSSDNILKQQLENYIIERITPNGNPVYGMEKQSIGDHRLDALNLAVVAFQLNFDELHKQTVITNVGAALDPRTINRNDRGEAVSIVSRPEARDLGAKFMSTEQELLANTTPGRIDLKKIKTNRLGWDIDNEEEEFVKYQQRKSSRQMQISRTSSRPTRQNI